MTEENDFIKHIVKTRRVVSEWPEWKRNLLGSSEKTGKTLKNTVASRAIYQKAANNK